MKETVRQFGGVQERDEQGVPMSARRDAPEDAKRDARRDVKHDAATDEKEAPMRCPQCGHHFSSEGRFCPFDREPLVPAEQWDPKADPLLGSIIDSRYAVEALIGEGGMGRVYRVRHVSLGKRFALKALRRDLASDKEIATRFIHEARTAASVTHPGLVQISDFGYLPTGQAYFVMELLDGLPLSTLLRRYGALPPQRAIQLASKIAAALAVAHAAGVVHRDLKPDNIHVRPLEDRDEVKIVDFGLAKVVGGSRLTRDGVVFGTPYYMSPEQASGEPTDHRADIYALGVVLYEMLTGRVPFEADTYMGVLTKHIYMKPMAPSEVLGIDGELGELEDVVMRCLEKRPDSRFSTLEEVHAALEAIPLESFQRLGPIAPVSHLAHADREEFDTAALASLPSTGLPTWALGVGILVASAALGSLVVAIVVRRSHAETAATELVQDSGAQAAAPLPSAAPPVASTAPIAQSSAPVAELASAAPRNASARSSAKPATRRTAPTVNPPRKNVPRSRDIVDPWAK